MPLGYRAVNKKLEIVPKEAEVVRRIFALYVELGSVGELARALEREGIRPKPRQLANGQTRTAERYTVGPLAHMLKNLSLPLIGSGRNGGVGRRGPAVEECSRRSGRISLAVSPWPATDAFERHCDTARMSAAHDADAARRTRSHDQGNLVGSSQSVVRHTRSAKAIAAPSVGRECP